MKYNITTVTDYLEELTGFNTHTLLPMVTGASSNTPDNGIREARRACG